MSCHAHKEFEDDLLEKEKAENAEKLFLFLNEALSYHLAHSKPHRHVGDENEAEFHDVKSGVGVSLQTKSGRVHITLSLSDEHMLNLEKAKAFSQGDGNIPPIVSGENLGNSEQIRQRAQAIAADIKDIIRDVNRVK